MTLRRLASRLVPRWTFSGSAGVAVSAAALLVWCALPAAADDDPAGERSGRRITDLSLAVGYGFGIPIFGGDSDDVDDVQLLALHPSLGIRLTAALGEGRWVACSSDSSRSCSSTSARTSAGPRAASSCSTITS